MLADDTIHAYKSLYLHGVFLFTYVEKNDVLIVKN